MTTERRYAYESRTLARARTRQQFAMLGELTRPLVMEGTPEALQAASQIARRAAEESRPRPLQRPKINLAPAPQPAAPAQPKSGLGRLADSLRGVVPQGVRDAAGEVGNELTRDFLANGLERLTLGKVSREDTNAKLDEWGVAGDVIRMGTAPTTVFTAGQGAGIAAGLRGGGALGKLGAALVSPVSSGGVGTRLAAETAFGVGAMKASEEVAERVEGPLQTPLAFLAGALGGGVAAGGVQGVRAAGKAAPSMLKAAGETGPLLRGEATPRAEIVPGAGDAFSTAQAKLRSLLNAEANIRRVGTANREISQGRSRQAGGISSGIERLGEGATLEDAAQAARQGARTGPLRETFADPLDLTPEENSALTTRLVELNSAGEIGDFDFLNASVTLNRLIKEGGQRLQPAQRRLLSRVIGEDVVDALEKRPPTQAAAMKVEQREITRERTRLDRVADRAREKAIAAETKANAASVDARLKQFSQNIEGQGPIQARAALQDAETQRLRSIDAFNKADRAEIDRLRSQLGVPDPEAQALPLPGAMEAPPRPIRLTNPVTGRPQSPAIERTLERMPNPEMMLARVRETAGDDPVLQEMVRVWLDTNRVVLDEIGSDPHLLSSLRSTIAGEMRDPWLTAAFHRRADLQGAMRLQGTDDAVAKRVATTLFERELQMRYGAERVFDDKGKVLQQFPEELRDMLEGTKRAPYDESLEGVDLFVQRFKNTIFGIFDVGVFGQQVLAAVKRGGVPMVAGYANRALSAMGHPLAPITYADSFLPRQLRYALDGLPQNVLTGAVQDAKESGSLLQYLGPAGRKIDEPYMAAADAMSRIQFGHVLTGVRNATYEGELVMLHMLGRDIANPSVRRAAIRSANTVTSFARTALKPGGLTGKGWQGRLQISAQMMRSRFAHVEQMAKAVFDPKATPEERILGSMMIASAAVHHYLLVKGLDAVMGTGDAELDPSHPNAGRITTRLTDADGRHLVIDLSPQDSVERAILRSFREIAEQDEDTLEQIGKVWAQVFLGPASPPARVALAGTLDTGYEPGRGYAYGDLSTRAKMLNVLPLPPIFQSLLTEGADPAGIVADTVGLTSFGESGYGEAERLAGKPLRDMGFKEREAFIKAHPEITKRIDADTARRGGKPAGALQVKQQYLAKQEALDAGLLDRTVTRQEWRNARGKFRDEQRGALRNIYGDRPITNPQNPYERWLQLTQIHTNVATDAVDWDAVDADMARLPESEQADVEAAVGHGQTPLSKQYARLIADYGELPVYRGYTADEAHQIDALWDEVRASGGDNQLRQLRAIRRLAGEADPRVVKAVRKRAMGISLAKAKDRDTFKKRNPTLAVLLGDGKITEADRARLERVSTEAA